jgi:hypothetical protein
MLKAMKADGVPSYAQANRPRKYPFPTMEVGEMFFVAHKVKNTMVTLASRTGTAMGKRFETRLQHMRLINGVWVTCNALDPGAIQGVGVYRTK